MVQVLFKPNKKMSFLYLQQLKLLKALSGYSSPQFSYLIISMYLFLFQFLFLLSDNPFLEGTKINSPFYLAKLNAPKGTKRFTLVVSQYEKTNTIHYTIKVCPPTFHLITSSYRPIQAFVQLKTLFHCCSEAIKTFKLKILCNGVRFCHRSRVFPRCLPLSRFPALFTIFLRLSRIRCFASASDWFTPMHLTIVTVLVLR